MQLILIAAGLITLSAVAFAISKCKRPFVTALKSAVSGFAGLLLINLTSGVTGCYIAVNACTAFVASVLSLPGVFALLVMKLIFNY
ncbi:MAG: pro-sigmaK processing inhibitor BofA family protein [Oscillospiraceae bacterium]